MLIKLMPYVHFQYNIICKNPTCEFMEDIRPLTIKEIMVKIFDEKNVTADNGFIDIKASDACFYTISDSSTPILTEEDDHSLANFIKNGSSKYQITSPCFKFNNNDSLCFNIYFR